eukprot:1859485-Pleurochrysis_carterae.AAC.4
MDTDTTACHGHGTVYLLSILICVRTLSVCISVNEILRPIFVGVICRCFDKALAAWYGQLVRHVDAERALYMCNAYHQQREAKRTMECPRSIALFSHCCDRSGIRFVVRDGRALCLAGAQNAAFAVEASLKGSARICDMPYVWKVHWDCRRPRSGAQAASNARRVATAAGRRGGSGSVAGDAAPHEARAAACAWLECAAASLHARRPARRAALLSARRPRRVGIPAVLSGACHGAGARLRRMETRPSAERLAQFSSQCIRLFDLPADARSCALHSGLDIIFFLWAERAERKSV